MEVRRERRVPRMRWEELMNEEKRAEYEEKTSQRWESRGNWAGVRWQRCM